MLSASHALVVLIIVYLSNYNRRFVGSSKLRHALTLLFARL